MTHLLTLPQLTRIDEEKREKEVLLALTFSLKRKRLKGFSIFSSSSLSWSQKNVNTQQGGGKGEERGFNYILFDESICNCRKRTKNERKRSQQQEQQEKMDELWHQSMRCQPQPRNGKDAFIHLRPPFDILILLTDSLTAMKPWHIQRLVVPSLQM